MSLIRNNQSDVRKHLSSPGNLRLHLVGSAAEPDATGFPGDGSGNTQPSVPELISQSAAGVDPTRDLPTDAARSSVIPPKPQA